MMEWTIDPLASPLLLRAPPAPVKIESWREQHCSSSCTSWCNKGVSSCQHRITIFLSLTLKVGGFTLRFCCTGFAFRFEHRKWNRGRNFLHQLGQPVAPSVLFPVFKSEGKPGTPYIRNDLTRPRNLYNMGSLVVKKVL